MTTGTTEVCLILAVSHRNDDESWWNDYDGDDNNNDDINNNNDDNNNDGDGECDYACEHHGWFDKLSWMYDKLIQSSVTMRFPAKESEALVDTWSMKAGEPVLKGLS